jgi:hypothetical protein
MTHGLPNCSMWVGWWIKLYDKNCSIARCSIGPWSFVGIDFVYWVPLFFSWFERQTWFDPLAWWWTHHLDSFHWPLNLVVSIHANEVALTYKSIVNKYTHPQSRNHDQFTAKIMNDFHLALTLIYNTCKASLKVVLHPKFCVCTLPFYCCPWRCSSCIKI